MEKKMKNEESIKNAIEQTNAIMALEGFNPNDLIIAINQAVLDGKITFKQAGDELKDYVLKYKTTNGFLNSKEWGK